MTGLRLHRPTVYLALALILGLGLAYTFTTLAQAQISYTGPTNLTTDVTQAQPAAVASVLVVDTEVDENDGGCADGDCSLRDAIDVAASGDTITFDSSYTIYLSSTLGSLSIDKQLTIDATGNPVTVSGDSGNDGSRDVRVLSLGSGSIVTLSHMIVVSGTASDGAGIHNLGRLTFLEGQVVDNYATNSGGGIMNQNGATAVINDSQIYSNTAAGGSGGGINNSQGGKTYLNGSLVSQNQSESGGGLALFNNSMAVLVDSTVTGNTASNGDGGGILNDLVSSIALTNTVVSLNNSTRYGGGIRNNGPFILHGGLIVSNTASTGGGGIYMASNSADLVQTGVVTVAYNQAASGGGMFVSGGAEVTLNRAMIFDNTATSGLGGGIRGLGGGRVLLYSSVVRNNQAGNGGGLGADNGASIEMYQSEIRENMANGGGGIGLFNNARAKLVDSTVYSNTATSGDGGGINIDLVSSIAMTNTVVSHNWSSTNGGGIRDDGPFSLYGGQILSNTASTGKGGGIYLGNRNADLTQTGVLTVAYNLANHGGGLFIDNSATANLSGSMIFSNTATTGLGGGIRGSSGGQGFLNSTTIWDNRAGSGGGIGGDGGARFSIFESEIRENNANNGGGIAFFNGGHVMLVDSTIYSNTAENGGGGGINVDHLVSVEITNTIVSHNRSTSNGGGIHSDGDLILHNVEILSNTVSAGNGGGIHMQRHSAVLTQTGVLTVAHNQAERGGGFYLLVKLASLNGARVLSNTTTTGNGGGIYNLTPLKMIDSSISQNWANGHAGGIYNEGQLVLNNVTLNENIAQSLGGGIGNYSGSDTTLINVTLSGNHASGGGGIWFRNSTIGNLTHVTLAENSADVNAHAIQVGSGSIITIENSIISSDAGPGCAGSPSIVSNGYNLEDQDSCGLGVTGDITNTIPLLDPLADNGGETWTHALQSGSQAINHIPFGINGCGSTIIEDQRGMIRPDFTSCDIGAFELESVIQTIYLPLILK